MIQNKQSALTIRFRRLNLWERFLLRVFPAYRLRYERSLNAGFRLAVERPDVAVEFADRTSPWNWNQIIVEKPVIYTLPTHCYSCGAYLMGSATKHKPGCEILRLIQTAFPK